MNTHWAEEDRKTTAEGTEQRSPELGAVPGSVTEPLHAYLARNIANGVIDFRIRAQLTPGGDVGFYIHPAHVSGDTRDYIIGGDIEAGEGWDFLFNAQRVPEPDVETFRRQLHASSQNAQAEPR